MMTNQKSERCEALANKQLEQLRVLAERATPGLMADIGYQKLVEYCLNNSEYIAALSPDVVLSLIAEVKRLRETVDLERTINKAEQGLRECIKGLDDSKSLRAENEELKRKEAALVRKNFD